MSEAPPPFDALWFQMVIGFITGICLGSFITMLSYRLPKRLSIIAPRSHCPSCKTTLGVRDLVPIGSWICSNGKCRHCSKKIGKRYVLIEIAAGLSSAFAFGLLGFQSILIVALGLITAAITWVTIMIEKKR